MTETYNDRLDRMHSVRALDRDVQAARVAFADTAIKNARALPPEAVALVERFRQVYAEWQNGERLDIDLLRARLDISDHLETLSADGWAFPGWLGTCCVLLVNARKALADARAGAGVP